MINFAPRNWDDRDAWDRYFDAELSSGHAALDPAGFGSPYVEFAGAKGGRIWFPGCGLDPCLFGYAKQGCQVLATDFSSVAVRYQQRMAAAFLQERESGRAQGSFAVAEQDFTRVTPEGEFDVVINCRAFQGLSPRGMLVAAEHFHAAIRPGGAAIFATMNVQSTRRDLIEDSLIAARFHIPFQKSERWYRQQLDGTGIVYEMVLGRPHIPACDQYPEGRFSEFAQRDQPILDAFQIEYERRLQSETDEVNAMVNDPKIVVAHVLYCSG